MTLEIKKAKSHLAFYEAQVKKMVKENARPDQIALAAHYRDEARARLEALAAEDLKAEPRIVRFAPAAFTLFLAAALLSSACGGPAADDGSSFTPPDCSHDSETLSAWGECSPEGIQTRVITSQVGPSPGCTFPPVALTQPCTYVPPPGPPTCPEQAPLICEVSSTLTMCCPSATPYYCSGLNLCVTAPDPNLCAGKFPDVVCDLPKILGS